jgi:hypothetical protein
MGNANNKATSMRRNPLKTEENPEEPPAEKTAEELQNARELEDKREEEFYKKNAIEIQIHKEMLLQRALNKDFKVKLPIGKILDFPVDVYLVFTHLKQYDINRDYYTFALQIFQKDSLTKILYAENLGREELICFVNVYSYFSNNNHSNLWILSVQLKTIYSIIKYLNKDTYMECFTKDKKRQTIVVDYTEYNVNLEFCTIYNCKTCGGQMKANTETCYFCRRIEEYNKNA